MCVSAYVFSHVRLFATPQTVACQALLSIGFSRQEYWSGLPVPSPGVLPDPGIKPGSPGSPTLAGDFFTTKGTWEVVLSIATSKSNQSATELSTVLLKCLLILLSALFSIPLSSDSLHFSPTYFNSLKRPDFYPSPNFILKNLLNHPSVSQNMIKFLIYLKEILVSYSDFFYKGWGFYLGYGERRFTFSVRYKSKSI